MRSRQQSQQLNELDRIDPSTMVPTYGAGRINWISFLSQFPPAVVTLSERLRRGKHETVKNTICLRQRGKSVSTFEVDACATPRYFDALLVFL